MLEFRNFFLSHQVPAAAAYKAIPTLCKAFEDGFSDWVNLYWPVIGPPGPVLGSPISFGVVPLTRIDGYELVPSPNRVELKCARAPGY